MPRKYERTFSRVDAPYMRGTRPTSCSDVAKLRSDVRRVALERDCQNVAQLPAFKQVREIHCELRADWLPPLSSLPKLDCLELTLPRSDKIPALKRLARLRSLILLCNRHQTDLKFLKDMTSVRSLCVSEAMGVSNLNPIASLPDLQELYIDGSMHRGRHRFRTLAPLAKLTDLRFLVLMLGSEQKVRPLRHLLPMTHLEYLYLGSSYRDEDELREVLDHLPRLKCIEFNGGLRWSG